MQFYGPHKGEKVAAQENVTNNTPPSSNKPKSGSLPSTQIVALEEVLHIT